MAREGDEHEAVQIGARIKRAAGAVRPELQAKDLAGILGVNVDTVRKIFRGESVQKWVDLIRLSRTLRTSPNELLGFDGGDSRGRLERLLAGAFRGLGASPPKVRNYVQTFLEVLDKPADPQEKVDEEDILRIQIDAVNKRS